MTRCRLCGSEAMASVVDLGATPPCESFLAADQLDLPEPAYALDVPRPTTIGLGDTFVGGFLAALAGR